MPLVRRGFDEDPERWKRLGNIARWARRAIVAAAVTDDDLLRIEACMRMIAAK